MTSNLPTVGNALIEQQGVAIVKEIVMAQPPTGLGFLFRDLPALDYGIDAQIEVVSESDGQSQATGKIISVQIKSGSSYFQHYSNDRWAIYIPKRTVNYWRSHSVPVILLLVDVSNREVYWTHADSTEHKETNGAFKIEVSRFQRLNSAAIDELRDLAEHTSVEGRRLARLEADAPLIAAATRGLPVVVDIAHWHNKSSGRMDYWIGVAGMSSTNTDDPNDMLAFSSGSVYGTRGDPISAAGVVAPWADAGPDDDFEEENRDSLYDEYLSECGTYDSEDKVYVDSVGRFDSWLDKRRTGDSQELLCYENNGEVSRYRLSLTPNELCRSYLSVRSFLKGPESESIPQWPPSPTTDA